MLINVISLHSMILKCASEYKVVTFVLPILIVVGVKLLEDACQVVKNMQSVPLPVLTGGTLKDSLVNTISKECS